MSGYTSYAYGSSNTRRSPPSEVSPDMMGEHLGKGNGKLESGSCAMAERFYNTYEREIIDIEDRRELGRFYVSVQQRLLENPRRFPDEHPLFAGKTLSEVTSRGDTIQAERHFRQVLFSLVTHGKVCRVYDQGAWISWRVNKRRMTHEDYRRNLDSRLHSLPLLPEPLDIPGANSNANMEQGQVGNYDEESAAE